MLAVRWLHVLGMAVALGGATAAWRAFRDDAVADAAAIGVAAAYERGFWAAVGVLVMSGVGNLGSLAPFVPDAGTRWGTTFAVKIALVVAVLVLSVVRTLAVHRCRRAARLSASPLRRLRIGYAATALTLAAVVALAEVLAHG